METVDCGAVHYAMQGGSNCWRVTIEMETVEHFPVVLFIMPCKVERLSLHVDEILNCDHHSKWKLLSTKINS